MKIIIDDILQKQNKTRYWLAKETGVTYPNIMKLCNNETSSIKFSMIESICNALNCTTNDIFLISKIAKQSDM